jgi:guanylate kinase
MMVVRGATVDNVLTIFAGCSGSGKSFLLNHCAEIGTNYIVVRKKTTRAPRDGENMMEFFFGCSKEEILKCDYYYTFRKRRNYWYGFNRKDIQSVLETGKSPLIVVRKIETISLLKRDFPGTIAILCQPGKNPAEQLRLHGHSAEEINERTADQDEIAIKEEYEHDKSMFDFIATNYFDGQFLQVVKSFLEKRESGTI